LLMNSSKLQSFNKTIDINTLFSWKYLFILENKSIN
jgi:hypothetical protein